MLFQALLFYLFATVLIGAALAVVFARNIGVFGDCFWC